MSTEVLKSENKTLFEVLRESTILISNYDGFNAGEFKQLKFTGVSTSAEKLANGSFLAKRFIDNGLCEKAALSVAATFIAENGCDVGGCDVGELSNFIGYLSKTSAEYKTAGQSKSVLNKQIKSWETERIPGYGEGIGSWTFAPMKKLVLSKIGVTKWRPFYNFDLNQQTTMAWRMLTEYQTGAYNILKSLTDDDEEADIKGLDAALRGIENGGGSSLASVSQINKYTWAAKFSKTGKGGYDGLMTMHYEYYISLKNHWDKCKESGVNPASGAKFSAQSIGYIYGGKTIEKYI